MNIERNFDETINVVKTMNKTIVKMFAFASKFRFRDAFKDSLLSLLFVSIRLATFWPLSLSETLEKKFKCSTEEIIQACNLVSNLSDVIIILQSESFVINQNLKITRSRHVIAMKILIQ